MTARGVFTERGATRRRVAISVLGLTAGALVLGGCSSSIDGAGAGGGGIPGASSAPATAPSTGSGATGSGGSDFCAEWMSGSSIAGLSAGQVRANFVTHWDKLAAIAPAEIKSDVQTIDDYLHTVLNQHPDPSKAASLATAVSDVVQYVAKNCH